MKLDAADVMSITLGLISDVQNGGSLLLAGLNIIVLALLIAQATKMFVDTLQTHNDTQPDEKYFKPKKDAEKGIFHTHLRLQTVWLAIMIVLTATVLKLVLQTDLANQIIAAWFVGQGFALQPYIQSYISGIVIRDNTQVFNVLNEKNSEADKLYEIKFRDGTYEWHAQHILSLTLKEKGTNNFIVVPWTSVSEMKFVAIQQPQQAID